MDGLTHILETNKTQLSENLTIHDIPLTDVSNIHHHYYSEFKFIAPNQFGNVNLTIEQEMVDTEEYKFVVMKNDTCIADSLRSNKLFEKFLLAILSEIVPKNKNMLDIGSNIGIWSIIFSKIINTENNIYAFEPQEKIFDCLHKNIILNNCKNIIPYNFGLSNKNDTFFMDASYDLLDNFGAFRITDDSSKSILSIECKIGDELSLDNIGFIKIDVEGHELNVLYGLKDTIQRNMPIIIIEIHSSDSDNDEKLKFFYNLHYKTIYKLSHCDYLVLP